MNRRSRIFILGLALAALPHLASGQSNFNYTRTRLGDLGTVNSASQYTVNRVINKTYQSAIPRYNFSNYSRNFFGSVRSGAAQKPFSSFNRGPQVTPYLGFGQPFNTQGNEYYTMIRPQMEQQKAIERQQQQIAAMEQKLGSIDSQPPFEIKGDPNMVPTGHPAVYMNYGGYFPPPTGQSTQQKRR
jgi:hypothetical protein